MRRVGAGAMHPAQRFRCFFGAEAGGIGDHHFGQADDGVKRGAQLVAHAGDELRLVLAGLRQLPVLILDFVEQPHVLDRNRRLVGEGLDQLDLLIAKWPHLGTRQRHDPDRGALAQQRNAEYGSIAAKCLSYLCPGVIRIGQHIGNVDDAAFEQGTSGSRSRVGLDRQAPDIVHELGGEAVRLGAKEHAADLPGYRGLVRLTKSGSRFDQRLQHRFEIEG